MKSVIEKYKKNELSDSEQAQLEDKLMNELFEERARVEWKNKLEANGISRSQPTLKVEKSNKFNAKWILVAASVALLAVVGSQFLMSPTPPVSSNFLAKYVAERSENTSSRMKNDPKTTWDYAKEAFSQKDYAKASALIESLGDKMDTEQQFYLAVSYFYGNNFAKAAANFDVVLKKNERKAAESRWYLALSQLKLNQKTEAIANLKMIIQENDHKVQEAKNLLSEIEKNK